MFYFLVGNIKNNIASFNSILHSITICYQAFLIQIILKTPNSIIQPFT